MVVSGGDETLTARGHFAISCADYSTGTPQVDARWETEFCTSVRERWNLDAWIAAAR